MPQSLFNNIMGLTHITWALDSKENNVGVFSSFLVRNGNGLAYNFEIQANPQNFLTSYVPVFNP